MARMYPERLPQAVLDDPRRAAEVKTYEVMRRLPGAYHVFYGTAWLGRRGAQGAADGEADFILVHPECGILVLEVKGGRIAYDGRTGKWTSTDRFDRTETIKDAAEQARDSKHALLRKMRALPELRSLFVRIGHGLVFPDCALVDRPLKPDLQPEIVLCAEDLEYVDQSVPAMFDFWKQQNPETKELGNAGCQALVRMLAPTFELRRSLRHSLKETDETFVTLTERQFRLLDMLKRNRRMAISGGAGTGKSLLALKKASDLAREGFRTLLTCFNHPLADHLCRCAGGVTNLEIKHFHRLCSVLAREAGLQLAFPHDEARNQRYFDEEMPQALMDSVERLPKRRFDAVVVDEGQDFAENWWLALQVTLADPDDGIFYVFYDDNQRIYRPSAGFPAALPQFSLTENVRNTKSIHAVASRFYGGSELVAVGPLGEPVEFVITKSGQCRKGVIRALHRLVTAEQVPAGDIAVLSGRAKEKSGLERDGHIDIFPIQPFGNDDPHKVVFESVHRFKGLESPVIIFAEAESLVNREDVLYVALSRARSHLIVVCPPELQDRLTAST